MTETIDQPAGIDRCQGILQTLFALTLMELGKFEWRSQNDHEWEVGRWSGLQLSLLANPEYGPHRPPFAICPLPGRDGGIPFILLITFTQYIEGFYSVGDTSVSVSSLTTVEIQRDVRFCAHQVFDTAVWLQLPRLEKNYIRLSRPNLPKLPCMKSMMEKQYPVSAPASAIQIGGRPIIPTL